MVVLFFEKKWRRLEKARQKTDLILGVTVAVAKNIYIFFYCFVAFSVSVTWNSG